MVRAERGQVELPEPRAGVPRRDPCQCHGVAVEAHQRDDGQGRDGPHRVDGELQLEQVVERLEHHDVDAAPFEDARLVGERRAVRVAGRSDRTADEHLAPGDLTRVSCELHAGRVDPLEVVLEKVLGQLVPVRTEGVRLDQLGAGVDEADVHRHDGVGCTEVGFLGAAQPGHRRGEHDSHSPVGDDWRPGAQAIGKAPGHPPERSQVTRSTTKRGMDQTASVAQCVGDNLLGPVAAGPCQEDQAARKTASAATPSFLFPGRATGASTGRRR